MAKTPAVRCPEFDSDFDLTLAKVIALPTARNRAILICSVLLFSSVTCTVFEPVVE